jgi:hypothetical protein
MTYSQEDMNRPVSGGFTRAELLEMNAVDMRAVLEGRLTKAEHEGRQVPAAAEQRLGEAIFGPDYTLPASPSQGVRPNPDPYQVTSWGESEEDFRAPSGQLCRLRKIDPTDLLEMGILDEVSRLPGLVQSGPMATAQGKPPQDDNRLLLDMLKDPTKLEGLMGLMDKLVAYVVVRPSVQVWDGKIERVPGQVYTDMIHLGDRMAIMEHAMGAVRKLDNFRTGPQEAV